MVLLTRSELDQPAPRLSMSSCELKSWLPPPLNGSCSKNRKIFLPTTWVKPTWLKPGGSACSKGRHPIGLCVHGEVGGDHAGAPVTLKVWKMRPGWPPGNSVKKTCIVLFASTRVA